MNLSNLSMFDITGLFAMIVLAVILYLLNKKNSVQID